MGRWPEHTNKCIYLSIYLSIDALIFFPNAILDCIIECYRNTYLSEGNEFNRVYFLRFCTKYDT